MSLTDEPCHISLEVVNEKCKGLRMLRGLGVRQYTLADIRGLPGGPTRHLIKIPAEQVNEIPRDSLTRVGSSGEAWFDSDGCEVCSAILSNSSFLVSARHVADSTIVYSFVVPNFEAFRSIVSTLEACGLAPKVLEVVRFRRRGKVLTEKQERVLWLALKLGFFDYPRKINTIELSRRLGVVPSTLSELTRRGLRKLVESYFEA